METPIFIASKKRAGDSKILTDLNEKNANAFIFVEPQEFNIYHYNYENLTVININQNNKGLPFVRQFMLNYAFDNLIELYWNLDDDVTLYKVENGKCIKADYKCLYEAEIFFAKDNTIAQAGLEYRQFAWGATKNYSFNSYCDCVVAIKPRKCINLKFDEKALTKLDRDFTIQVINAGFKTIKINSFAFSCPANGSNKGGLYEVYKSGIEKQNSEYMESKWGANVCVAMVKPDGRNDVKIYWNEINSNQISLF